MPGLSQAEPAGTFSPFRYPVFRAIWIANLFSNLGATIQSVAAAWLMTELTDSKQLIGMVQASATLPIMLFGMIAGSIADNFDRRRVMLAAQIGMLLTSSALAALTYLGMISPFILLAFTLTIGAGTALNSPAWQSSVRQTVPKRELSQAIALNSMSFNLARSVGPALGGLLISIWDVSLAFAINAVSYFALIFVLLWWKPEIRRVARRPIFPAIAVGLRYCMDSSPIRRLLLRCFFIGFTVAAYQALLPSIVREQLGGSELDFGFMLAMFGVGSIVIAPFVGKIRRRLELEGLLAASALIYVFALIVIAEVDTVTFAAPVAFLAGVAWVSNLTSLNLAMQYRSPDDMLGRCLSIYQATTFGGMALGSWAWGAVADVSSLPFALHAASAVLAAGSIALWRLAPAPRRGEGIVRE
ncbi:MAG: MFS transporter [Sphingomonadaceae bacterium]|nr:MFS transporter [Sphingomonadaceae bacterium]